MSLICDYAVDTARIKQNKYSHRNLSFLPTIMTRLSPFVPVSRTHNDTVNEPTVAKHSSCKVTVSDAKLSIYDETVMLALFSLLRRTDTNTIMTTTNKISTIMEERERKKARSAITKSLSRMSKVHVSIERKVHGGKMTEMNGPIIIGIDQSMNAENIAVELNPYFRHAVENRLTSTVDIQMRSYLRGDVSKALHRYFEGQRSSCLAISVSALSKAVNVAETSRRTIKRALRELEVEGYLRRFILPDNGAVVAIFKSKYRTLRHYYTEL